MNHLIWAVSLVGILSTAVVFGTDMFYLTVGRPALISPDGREVASGSYELGKALTHESETPDSGMAAAKPIIGFVQFVPI